MYEIFLLFYLLDVCPKGLAWFDEVDINTGEAHKLAECSNRGVCNRQTGECQCFKGFTGSACENSIIIIIVTFILIIYVDECPPLSYDDTTLRSTVCSGHGKCMTLREYKNREGFEAKEGWELDSVRKCVCYKGYTGDSCNMSIFHLFINVI